ncbi:MAG: SpoIID/LytB domain-containing protein [Bacteroidales bacterium]|nr:SpoIID/LytB domain-containing protein [Bacteroidales bacterium]
MRLLILVSFIFIISANYAQSIKIGLYNNTEINTITVSIRSGRYQLKSNGDIIGEYRKGNIFFITRHNNKFDVRDKKNFIGDFNELEIASTGSDGVFTLKTVNPDKKGREYNDNLLLKVVKNKIQLVNKVELEKYIAGVIEAECGPTSTLEFYKAQAVLIRTYTIKNMFKHGEEGFNLCDQVHCQVHHGRSLLNDNIYKATSQTAGQVLIDKDSILILSPFHANCGGHTSESGMVWQSDLPYLPAVADPFCNTGKHSNWTATLSKTTWQKFLVSKGVPVAVANDLAYNYTATERKKYLLVGNVEISFREIRERFKLKSTFFSIKEKGNDIVFQGKGFGHGAGMCQEGAMEMSRVGYTYLDIIHFYFKDVSITDYREMEIDRY